jgi:hypothetical protein
MAYSNPFKSLLGAFTPQQPDPYQSLLGDYYDPKREALSWLGGNLAGVGMGLASGKPGAWATGGIAGGQQGIDDYQRQAVAGYAMNQRKQEYDYQQQQREEEAAAKQAEEEAQSAAIAGLPPEMQSMAKAFPNAVIPGYVKNKYFPDPVDDSNGWRYASSEEKQQLGVGADAPLVITKSGPKLISTGAPTINVMPNGEPPDGKLRTELSKNEGTTWSDYQKGADVSGGLVQDLQALDELSKVAPQGPVSGRLAQAFPGFSSAGAAYQSIVSRVAPTLRAPGSGSTSDVEYNGFLNSLPKLQNLPEGNAVISAMLQRKAQINIQRGDIVNAYANGEISAVEARKQLGELNRKSILDPQIKALIAATGGSGTTVDDVLSKYPAQPQQ